MIAAYIARFGALGPCKVGSSGDVATRLDQISVRLWDQLYLLRMLEGGAQTERALHRRFDHLRIRCEWFHYHPDMMGDLGFADVDQGRAIPTAKTRAVQGDPARIARSAALRGWMIREGLCQRSLAAATGHTPSTVSEWLHYGHLPQLRTRVKLVEMSGGELAAAFMPILARASAPQPQVAP